MEEEKHQCCMDKRSHEPKKNFLMIGMVALILVIVVFQSFQINAMKGKLVTAAGSSGPLDMSSWSEDEKMMYEHHGVKPQRLQTGKAPQASSGMVGGC